MFCFTLRVSKVCIQVCESDNGVQEKNEKSTVWTSFRKRRFSALVPHVSTLLLSPLPNQHKFYWTNDIQGITTYKRQLIQCCCVCQLKSLILFRLHKHQKHQQKEVQSQNNLIFVGYVAAHFLSVWVILGK